MLAPPLPRVVVAIKPSCCLIQDGRVRRSESKEPEKERGERVKKEWESKKGKRRRAQREREGKRERDGQKSKNNEIV